MYEFTRLLVEAPVEVGLGLCINSPVSCWGLRCSRPSPVYEFTNLPAVALVEVAFGCVLIYQFSC